MEILGTKIMIYLKTQWMKSSVSLLVDDFDTEVVMKSLQTTNLCSARVIPSVVIYARLLLFSPMAHKKAFIALDN